MTDVTQSPNGSPPAMTQVVDVLRDAIAAHTARRDQLAEELAGVKAELTNYEKALTLLSGEPRVKPGPKPKALAGRTGTRIGSDRLAEIEGSIRDYVNQHGDVEFRQIDIREFTGNTMTSGVSSFAFKELRDRDVLRVARKDGNNLYYRLTRRALAE